MVDLRPCRIYFLLSGPKVITYGLIDRQAAPNDLLDVLILQIDLKVEDWNSSVHHSVHCSQFVLLCSNQQKLQELS